MELLGEHITKEELAGFLITLLAIWLTVKENRWCFPTGIISCLIYAYVFNDPRVRYYADSFLQLIYIPFLIYGWITWNDRKKQQEILRVTQYDYRHRLLLGAVILASTLITGYFLKRFTTASLPYVDAFTTSMSLAAQWMVARKKIENWYVWILANIIYVYMYIHKELYVTSILYFLLLVLAFAGLNEWKKHRVPATS